MENTSEPGELIVRRYMPNASPQEHEAALETLRTLARLVLGRALRRARERHRQLTSEGGSDGV